MKGRFPTVAVHEFAIHPTSGEVVVATHGRSLWVLDVHVLRQVTTGTLAARSHLYTPAEAIYWRREPQRGGGTRQFTGENPPDGAQLYYSLGEAADAVTLQVRDVTGRLVRELEGATEAGLHRVDWDLREAPPARGEGRGRRRRGRLVPSGTYMVTLEVGGQALSERLEVRTDPDYPDYAPWEWSAEQLDWQEVEHESYEDADGAAPDDGIVRALDRLRAWATALR